jgi:hypothetical protein
MIAIVALFLLLPKVQSWSGILIDGYMGNTQLYIPGDPPVSVQNVNFSLPHFYAAVGIAYNNRAYIIGGYNWTSSEIYNSVRIFDPNTNTTSFGPPMNYARYWHAATV